MRGLLLNPGDRFDLDISADSSESPVAEARIAGVSEIEMVASTDTTKGIWWTLWIGQTVTSMIMLFLSNFLRSRSESPAIGLRNMKTLWFLDKTAFASLYLCGMVLFIKIEALEYELTTIKVIMYAITFILTAALITIAGHSVGRARHR